MEQITIRIKDKSKGQALLDFLKTLEFVENVSSPEVPLTKDTDANKDDKFLSLAGLWAGRDISLASIRRQAWPERS
jgi:hypothetical protein